MDVLLDFDPARDLNSVPEPVRLEMAARGLDDTYYLATVVLGYEALRPNTHGPLCAFLDTCTAHRRLIQMPRSHFKTTCVTIAHRIQEVLKDTSRRILIIGDADTNAQKHLLKIKQHFERNRLLRWLYPNQVWEDPWAQATEWSKVRLYLPTKAVHGEPTFDTAGARGAVVSRHFDTINPDDIIGEKEAYSPTDMDRTIEWVTGLESLLVPPIAQGQIDIPSTYWRTDDVYAFLERFYGGGHEQIETGPFSYQKGSLAVFRRGVLEDGKLIFPEAIEMEFIERLQQENPERFAAQYANNPYDSKLTFFSPKYIRNYEWRVPGQVLTYTEGDMTHIVHVANLTKYSFCDPRGSDSKRFRSSKASVVTTGYDPLTGRIFVLDTWIQRQAPHLLISEIIRQNEFWMPEVFSIEANGLQGMVKFWLDERVEREGRVGVPYQPYIPKGPKTESDRRIRGLQPLWRAGHIYTHRSQVELHSEYAAWPRGSADGLDSLAQGLDWWPIGFQHVEQEMMDQYEQRLRESRSVATGY